MHKQMTTFEYPMNLQSHQIALKMPLNPPPGQTPLEKTELFGRLICQALVHEKESPDPPKFYISFGHYFAGDFDEQGFKHGKGIYIFGGGEGYYQGEFSKDKKHGFGRLVYFNGKVKEGKWIEGKFKGDVQSIIKH